MEDNIMKVQIKKFFLLLATVVMVALCGLLVACGEPEAVNQQSIKYDGYALTWDAVEGANGYTITVNGGKEYSSSTNQFSYPAASTDERIEVTIVAKNGDKAGAATTKLFTRLPKIEEENISFDINGKMTWTQVSGAMEYILEINDTQTRTPALEYSAFPQGRENKIRIKPVAADDSSFAEWSVQLIKDYLAAPSNIKYDGQFISWMGNNAAQSYQLYINGAQYGEPVTGTTFTYDAGNATFELQIQSIGDGARSFHSQIGDKTRFVFLKDITGIKIEDGVLVWDEVEEATGYKIKLNGVEQTVDTNSFDNLPAGRQNTIQIKPITAEGTTYFANWSQEQTVGILPAPVLRWDDTLVLDGQKMNVISWDGIDGDVSGYNVKVINPKGESRVVPLGPDAVTYGAGEKGEAFELTGTYTVSIQTVAPTGSNSYPSEYSAPIEVIRLPAPNAAMQNFITSDPSDVKEGFSIAWQNVSGASGYQLYLETAAIGGTITNTVTRVPYNEFMSENDTERAVFNFSVQSVGNVKTFNTQRKVTLSSLTSQSLKATVTVLAQPSGLTMDGYKAKWNAVDGATSYGLTVGDRASSNTNEYDLANLAAGTYTLAVCAKGNGGDLLASNYTASKELVRLAAPFDIEIDPMSDGDRLTWDGTSQHADHYDIYWENDPEKAIDASSITDMKQYFTTQSRGLFMRASANYWNDPVSKDIYFITSGKSETVTFTKLATPTFEAKFVNEAGTKLVWNAPSNVQSTTITYRVFDNQNFVLNGAVSGCEYDISTLAGGESYNFKVQAVGYGTYVSSEPSATVGFHKLATPELNAFTEGDKAYTWPAVAGEVVRYAVYVDGVEKADTDIRFDATTSTYSYAPDFTTMNEQGLPVKIYAIGDGYTVINSSPCEFTQKVYKASKPGFTWEYQSEGGTKIDKHEPNAKIVVSIAATSNHTDGYRVTFTGKSGSPITKEIAAGATTCEYTVSSPDEYTIRVYARGKVFGADGNYYVESDSANEQKATILAAPSALTVNNNTRTISFSGSASTYEYIVTYEIDGQEYTTEPDTKRSTTITLSSVPAGAVITKVEIWAKGNGSTTISSETYVWVKP